MATLTPSGTIASQADRRRVLFATTVGTTIEWYDFFIYASAAALVFNTEFFEGAGPRFATLLSFATIGVSFLFRPLGAFLAGHLGDRIGRRPLLVWTLILMGTATTLVGLLPTYNTIGLTAPILLILLRVVQGISAGGEWGGAVLMAVEHAPLHQRGRFGASPQIGVPLGLLIASGVLAIMAMIAPGAAFLAWGWRIPFLLSVVLIVVGYFVRRGVDESPVFAEISKRAKQTRAPILVLLRHHLMLVIVAAVVFAGSNAVGYMTTGGYIQNYATDPTGTIHLQRGPVLWAITVGAVAWLITTWLSGRASDRFGRKATLIFGWVCQLIGVTVLFPLVNVGTIASLVLALVILSFGIGFAYGPISTFYTELFPAPIRFSGVSISYALGAIIGGAFAPMIAAALFQATGTTWSITAYLGAMTILGLAATLVLRDRSGIPLGPGHVTEQEANPFIGTTTRSTVQAVK